jgi:hypothetical protein
MSAYETIVDVVAEGLTTATSDITVGEMSHPESFSWAPTATPTNGEDHFFSVPMAIPLINGNFASE